MYQCTRTRPISGHLLGLDGGGEFGPDAVPVGRKQVAAANLTASLLLDVDRQDRARRPMAVSNLAQLPRLGLAPLSKVRSVSNWDGQVVVFEVHSSNLRWMSKH